MGVVSQFLLQSCTITRSTNVDSWGGTSTDTTISNVACRFQREQKLIKMPDGRFVIATGSLMLDGDTNIQAEDTVIVEGSTYKVLTAKETRGLDGSLEMVTAYLS